MDDAEFEATMKMVEGWGGKWWKADDEGKEEYSVTAFDFFNWVVQRETKAELGPNAYCLDGWPEWMTRDRYDAWMAKFIRPREKKD